MPALLSGYVLSLAGVSAVALFVGSVVSGLSIATALMLAGTGLLVALCGVAVMSVIIDALAPTFGAHKDSEQAAKVAAYSPTPAWIAGVAQIVPYVGGLIALVGALYALYLLYLGLMRVMKSPPDKVVAYTVAVVVVAIILGFVVSLVLASVGFGSGVMPGYMRN
jgi:hypothetical protein